MRIRCVTLFDITNTGVSRRNILPDEDSIVYTKKRNQQINFETILQIISMRCQPEEITVAKKILTRWNNIWGTDYSKTKEKIATWSFEFTVSQESVFHDGINELGNLYLDSDTVPMIIKLDESLDVGIQINTSAGKKNIHFEVIGE